ncbi:hypothetical protein [Absidia glauca]|uniref:Ndc10 domain-containing protein n=1 Tax=Absidia glauca TaxID=4829 RepID=A0A163KKA1_ABSGL|nr:hypothetical protein [Absidia glauca]
MKIKSPRHAQEWFHPSHQKSIGKALSSPGIRSNKNTHINCGSSAPGFPTYGRFFHPARAVLNSPTSLCKKLFPAIGE